MVAALVTVAAILVGLPLLARWLGGRRFWRRLRPSEVANPYGETLRRYRLTPVEMVEVQSAMSKGRELTDPRLRAAVADWRGRRWFGPTGRGRVGGGSVCSPSPRLRASSGWRWARSSSP